MALLTHQASLTTTVTVEKTGNTQLDCAALTYEALHR